MNSLRTRLLVIIGGSLVVLWAVVAAWMMAELRGELRTAMDDRLAASARMVAGLASQFPAAALRTGAPATPLLDVVARDGLACEVSLLRGEVSTLKVARTASSPAMDDVAPGYSTRMFGGKPWRTYVLQQGELRIATADRIDVREAMLRNVALTAAVPFAVALVGSLLAVWFGIGRGLAPLERLRGVLAARRPDDDSALPQQEVPRELAPLVGTIARLLERVRSTITRERRFTDDAAHELRTPLTAVKTHLQVLRLSLGGQPRSAVADALEHADQGVLRMQRSLEQLLLLARLEAGEEAQPGASSPPEAAARQAVREVEASCPGAGRIEVDVQPALAPTSVPDRLVVSGVRNLVENAVRASPAGGAIRLEVRRVGEAGILFRVLDRGPGLTQEECTQALRRFWRRGRSGDGSGLGLSIVDAIAQRYGGTLRLAPRPGGGLMAELVLPA
ncbi:MAG: ATP-binding protein [Ramlibacter sp.]